MAEHESTGKSNEWYTPPWVFCALDIQFDLDAASPGANIVPWVPAYKHITSHSLNCIWHGSVWLNPPYGGRNAIRPWLRKICNHSNGIALVPNRTATDWFQDFAQLADALLFVRKKIKFIRPDGIEAPSPGYGNVLMAFGENMADKLRCSKIDGLRLETPPEPKGE